MVDGEGRSAVRRPKGARGRWALRDYPGVLWMVLAVVMVFIHPFVPSSRWLMVHLVLLGALTHSIMVWSTHFTQTLLKTAADLDDRRVQSGRLILLFAGTCVTMVGVPTAWWPVTVIGAVMVVGAVVWHGIQILRRLRAGLPSRFRITVHYYLAAACCLPVGAALGVLLAFGLGDELHGRILLAHSSVNVLGWAGLTVTGTLVTLWPTMLRTPMSPSADTRAKQALPMFLVGLVALLAGAVTGLRWLAIAGLAVYAVGMLWWAWAVLSPVRRTRPREFAPASVGFSLIWWVFGVGVVLVRLASVATWDEFADGFGPTSAVLVVGFAAQLLPGALSYLLPSVLGGGKTVVRAGQHWFDKWGGARLFTTNVGLVVCLLPIPSLVRVVVSTVVVASLATFIPLMVRGIIASTRAKREAEQAREEGRRPTAGQRGRPDRMPSIWRTNQILAAAIALLLAISVSTAVTTGGSAGSTAAPTDVAPTGETTTVEVVARDMHFEPSSIEVPAGDRLVIEVVNEDPANVHDLQVLGQTTPRLAQGERATLDVGVVGESTRGICTIVGHEQMGMVLDVIVDGVAPGANPSGGADKEDAGHDGHDGATGSTWDPAATVNDPIDPALPPAEGEVHRIELVAREVELEVAPGVTQRRWTFNGQVPGPTLRGKVGDTFEITLTNDGTMGHSIDFHASHLAPDEPMRTIAPGESLTYDFTAHRSGIWMYHCSTAPMSTHIAAGMFGAVIIDPPDLLPVDREYVLVQSETYLQGGSGRDGAAATDVDADAIAAEEPTFVAFNGIAGQYEQEPLTARVGERVRFWILDAGPNRATSFHVIGGQFDTVFREGHYQLGPRAETAGAQALGLQSAQGGFVELTFPEAGHYPFVSHIMVDAERGAKGIVEVRE